MLYLSVFSLFLIIFLLTYLLLLYLTREKAQIKNRIILIREMHLGDMERIHNQSFTERAIRPYFQSFSRMLMKLTPTNKVVLLNKRLERAGLLKNTTTEKWLLKKHLTVLVLSLSLSIFAYMIEPAMIKALTVGVIISILMNVILKFLVSKKITMRKKKILKDLPYILDLITVSVEAGLSFDGAIARVVNNISGELCDEFGKSLKEIRMGLPRKIALKNLSERTQVKELSLLVTSIIQADELGVSLGNVLRIEASNLREHRKQVTREKAMKVPIKMLFPLIFFIFPSIFIIILGPAVIKIFNIFLR